ncbi:MAG: HAD family hydrolase [Flavobacteriales bacterium]|nr:HAD family hydrolase [Flavobacteriales bacterium]PIY10192.1 MAG: HAD family hydrolase [Flavobacteriaceae bacterium CG_4_10_14_3_um_filter_33_47]PJB18222.1 MAG: HAD family hydrolase [Flavobacteriaceae bacterium CG_4_9_14_3_um_filter_33_16]
MSQYKCVIFDCDGVLVDSEPISNQILTDMANKLGANTDLDFAMKHFKGSHFKDCIKIIESRINQLVPETFETEYRTQSLEAFEKHLKPIKGIKEVIEHLTLPFCVASSGMESKMRFNLNLVGLLPYFENKLFSCYTIQKFKPEPDVFLWAAKTMGYKPHECIVIEDSVLGVQGAVNGGFDVFGFTQHDTNNELEVLATKTFNNMDDLLKMLY